MVSSGILKVVSKLVLRLRTRKIQVEPVLLFFLLTAEVVFEFSDEVSFRFSHTFSIQLLTEPGIRELEDVDFGLSRARQHHESKQRDSSIHSLFFSMKLIFFLSLHVSDLIVVFLNQFLNGLKLRMFFYSWSASEDSIKFSESELSEIEVIYG